MTSLLSLALVAWGCGGGSGGPPDAASGPDARVFPDGRTPADASAGPDALPPADARIAALDCLGNPLPDTAPNPLTIAGTVFSPGIPGITSDMLLEGATVESFLRGTDTVPIATTTSAANGSYTLSADNSAQTPVNAYLRSAVGDYWTTYLYPPTPVYSNQTDIEVVMTTPTQFNLLSSFASVTPDATKGLIMLAVVDCNGDPVHGAIVTSTPPTDDVVYMSSDGTPSDTASATNADGVALLFNVPTGDVEIAASYSGMDLRSHTVNVRATNHDGAAGDESVVTTVIRP